MATKTRVRDSLTDEQLNELMTLLGGSDSVELTVPPEQQRAAIRELSTKCLPSEAFQVAAETRVYPTENGIDLSGEQQTKTRTALEFFSSELATG